MADNRVFIGAVEKQAKLGTFNHQDVINGRAPFSCIIQDTVRPSLGAEVQWTEDAVARFGGFIDRTEERGPDGQELPEFETEIVCVSYDTLADRRFVTETLAAGDTLEDWLTQLEPYVTDYGASLSATQATGPTMADTLTFDGELLSKVLDKISEITGWVWKFAPDKTFSMFDVGSVAAPFDIDTADDPAHYVGDIQVVRSRDKYFNRVIAKYGRNVVVMKTQSFVGDGVADTFPLDYAIQGPFQPVATEDQAVAYGVVDYVGSIETIAGASAPSGYQWEYDPVALTITRRAGAVANAVPFTFRYDVQFPQVVTVEDASEISANGLSELAIEYPEVYDKALATALAEAELEKALDIKIEAKYQTYDTGLAPGMSQTITEPYRNLSGSFLITEVRTSSPRNTQDLLRSVTAISGTRFRGSYRDLIRAWLGGGNRTANAGTGPTVSPGSAAAPPVRSVQFNRAGTFGGLADVVIDEDQSGDFYGIGGADGNEARLAVSIADSTAGLAQAWTNRTAGLGKALLLRLLDGGQARLSHHGGGSDTEGIALLEFGGPIHLDASRNVRLTSGVSSSYQVRAEGLLAAEALAWNTVTVTTTPYALDVGVSGGSTPYKRVLWDRSSAGTITLPALSNGAITPLSNHYREVTIKNIGTAVCTIDADSSELIYDGARSALTLILMPGWSVTLNAGSSRWDATVSRAPATVTLNNAQIKALPSAYISVLIAPPTGYVTVIERALFILNSAAGAYTNVTAGKEMGLAVAYGDWDVDGTGFAQVSTTAEDGQVSSALPWSGVPSAAVLAAEYPAQGQYLGSGATAKALKVIANNTAGDFTGGHANNTMRVKVWYDVEALAA